jgi:hypothetical protein
MPTKFRLVLIVALILASLGFSAYGVALAAPSFSTGHLGNAISMSEASGTPEASQTPEVTESPDATESPEAAGSPDVSQMPEATESPDASEMPKASETPEPSDTPDVSETHASKDMQAQDGNNAGQNQDTQRQSQIDGIANQDAAHHDGGDAGAVQHGGGGDSLSAWALLGGRY